MEFRPIELLWVDDTGSVDPAVKGQSLLSCSLWVDYIYLDTDERRRFAQVSHEYLIEQLQYTGEESINNTANKIRLSFNHPSKELIWVVQKDSHIGTPGARVSNQWSNYQLDAFDVVSTPFSMFYGPDFGGVGGNFSTTGGVTVGASFGDPVVYAKLQLNGHDRFAGREGTYFNLVQLYQHHTSGAQSEGINVYSFGLKPEEQQPSGTVNFSRIDNATLQFSVHPGTFQAVDPETGQIAVTTARVRIYATNYNVLRIMSGINIENANVPRDIVVSTTCAEQETPLLVPDSSNREKVCKILGLSGDNQCNLLVHSQRWATLSNCGKLLIAFITTPTKQFVGGTRLITEPNSKKMKDGTIRSQASLEEKKVQRLDGSGSSFGREMAQGIVQTTWKQVEGLRAASRTAINYNVLYIVYGILSLFTWDFTSLIL